MLLYRFLALQSKRAQLPGYPRQPSQFLRALATLEEPEEAGMTSGHFGRSVGELW